MTREEWYSWRRDPRAKVWEERAQKEVDDMQGTFYFPDSVDRTALAAAHVAGMIEMAELLLNLEPNFEDEDG